MSKKKSLGHNPLAYSTRRHASFDFIAPSDSSEESAEKSKSVAPSHKPEEKPKKAAPSNQSVNKVTASYYLEEPLVNKVKAMANENNTTYSAIVSDILKDQLDVS